MRFPALIFGLSCLASPLWAQDGTLGCASAPDPVLTLDYESRYVDGDETRSTLDEDREAEAKAALDPLDEFIRALSERTEVMLSTEDDAQRQEQADCILAQMADWARQDALADLVTETVQLTIGSRLAAFGIVAIKASEHHGPMAEGDLAAVADWLATRVNDQMMYWETAPNGATQGNLRAWAALAGSAVAQLTDDVVIRSWATWSTTFVLCTANEDGSIPQEMRRGKRALHYQLHAVAPLVTSVMLLDRQGVALDARCDSALHRAVSFALSDLETGAKTEAITGEVQTLIDGSDPLEDFQLAWLESYLRLSPDPVAAALAADLRPLNYSKLGGNQTLLWAEPEPEAEPEPPLP